MKVDKNWCFPCLFFLLSLTCLSSTFCFERDKITATNFITDPQSIASNGSSSFELGFFTPLNSTSRFVGIWFTKYSPQTVVWVANRDNPLNNTSGMFKISEDGNVVVVDRNNTVVWSSNVSSLSSGTNTSARVLNSGNLVLEDTASGKIIWDSLEHPCDKLLPSMRLMTNTRTKEKTMLTSWNTPSDPSTGNFFAALEVLDIPEVVVWSGRTPYWRSGPWNGRTFMGVLDMDSNYISGYNLEIDYDTFYLYISNNNYQAKQFAYVLLNSGGNLEQTSWDEDEEHWKVTWSALRTRCDYYGACGEFGICNAKASPICSCLKGFKPKQDEEWNQGNWSGGCVRKTMLKCQNLNTTNNNGEEDGFLQLGMVKVPFFVEWSRFI